MGSVSRRVAGLSLGAAAFAVVLASTPPAHAQIAGETVAYEIDGERFEGYVARNPALAGDLPVVVVIHDWDGLGAYEERRAEMLAEAGYAAIALDLYGAGIRPETLEERRARTGALYADRERMRRLMTGGIEALLGEGMDGERLVTMGYCFGGAAALELARSGAEALGFVSFHGGLGTPDGQDYGAVTAPVLILHGSADPVAPMSEVADLATRMDEAGVVHSMEIYGGADHAFTVWDGERYDGAADLASWETFLRFLDEQL
ncbi:dienelactone hydrolase family protein [Algihabitans albus]|uniref:dienelactone hydrolase family protein n=1 Tax=Algihabitans albus TaxID=2164067 RepID=UPI000E5CE711|nr:dienelactone hydrolase family protein [Algihabitans albus]